MKYLSDQFLNELDARIKDKPFYCGWENTEEGFHDYIKIDGEFDFAGLNDHEKIVLIVYAWNKSDICPGRCTIIKTLNWSKYKVSKLARELKPFGLECVATFCEWSLKLNGRGYLFTKQY